MAFSKPKSRNISMDIGRKHKGSSPVEKFDEKYKQIIKFIEKADKIYNK